MGKFICLGTLHQRLGRDAGPAPRVIDGPKFTIHAGRHDTRGIGDSQSFHQPKPKPDRIPACVVGSLKRVVPARLVDAGGTNLHAMSSGIADDLGRDIKAHGRAIDQSGAKGLRVMAFDIIEGISADVLV
jgi:hypothetical protein